LGGLLSAAAPSKSGEGEASIETRVARVGADDYNYQVYVPGKIRNQPGTPLIVFLHGIGQRGTGGVIPTGGAAGAIARHFLEQVPANILLPQCREGSYWTDPVMTEMVMTALGQTVEEFGAEARRLYLTGVSMGGYGVWHLASQHPDRFAGLVSICGGSPLREGDRFTPIARRIAATPAWIFHGADDRVVAVSESRRMAEALKAAGGEVRYSEYAGVGHNVWMKVLKERELMPWLMAQHME
jgi:predicted peptidase